MKSHRIIVVFVGRFLQSKEFASFPGQRLKTQLLAVPLHLRTTQSSCMSCHRVSCHVTCVMSCHLVSCHDWCLMCFEVINRWRNKKPNRNQVNVEKIRPLRESGEPIDRVHRGYREGWSEIGYGGSLEDS